MIPLIIYAWNFLFADGCLARSYIYIHNKYAASLKLANMFQKSVFGLFRFSLWPSWAKCICTRTHFSSNHLFSTYCKGGYNSIPMVTCLQLWNAQPQKWWCLDGRKQRCACFDYLEPLNIQRYGWCNYNNHGKYMIICFIAHYYFPFARKLFIVLLAGKTCASLVLLA